MAKKQQEYGNDSIRQLKGADRVRKRPAVIFGSDGVEGCAHSIFEIISNSIDEARDGHGNRINVTLFPDHVVGEQRDIDAVAVAVACLVNRVGDNLKDGVRAALDTVRAKDNRRALTHTVGALQLTDTVIAVFLLFFCHAAVPSDSS